MKHNSWTVMVFMICFGCTLSGLWAADEDFQAPPPHHSGSSTRFPGELLPDTQPSAPKAPNALPDSYGSFWEKVRDGEITVQKLENGDLQITVATESSFHSVLNSISGNSKDWRLNGPWLIFCICAIACLGASLYLFYFKARNNILAFRITVLMVLSISSLILIVGGYAKEQIVPVIGFFSTIAGFLLGSKTDAANHNDESDQ